MSRVELKIKQLKDRIADLKKQGCITLGDFYNLGK